MAISVKMRGGFFRFTRASSSSAGICFSRAISDRSRSSGEANLRSISANAPLAQVLE